VLPLGAAPNKACEAKAPASSGSSDNSGSSGSSGIDLSGFHGDKTAEQWAQEFLAEHNKMRTDPTSFVAELE